MLISPDGELKIADFGLARDFGDPGSRMTSQVITRWYRPPELLLGARSYSGAVDMWSVGCIFAELMLRTPYLPGESDAAQLTTIFRALGSPTEREWPGMKLLPDYVQVEHFPKQPLHFLFTAASADTLDLLAKCLVYNPNDRITASHALRHAYFRNQPAPTPYQRLPKKAAKKSSDAAEGEGAGGTDEHPLLSDSGVKNARRQAAVGDEAARRAAAGAKRSGNKRQLKEEEIEARKRLARKLAFG